MGDLTDEELVEEVELVLLGKLTGDLSPKERRELRKLADAPSHVPVRVTYGRRAPELEGEGPYHTNRSGSIRVQNPVSYGYKTVYHASTRQVSVGETWLLHWRRKQAKGTR